MTSFYSQEQSFFETFSQHYDRCRITTFIHADDPDAIQKMKAWGRKNSIFGVSDYFINDTLSGSHAVHKKIPLVTFKPETRPENALIFPDDLDKESQTCITHEVGHIVTENGHMPQKTHFLWVNETEVDCHTVMKECAADLFTAVYGLRHGWIDKEDIVRFSLNRTLRALLGDHTHATYRALDYLVDNIDQHDWVNMTHEDIVAFADQTSSRFKPSPRELDDLGYFKNLMCEFGLKAKDIRRPADMKDYLESKNTKERAEQSGNFYDRLDKIIKTSAPDTLLHEAGKKLLNNSGSFLPPRPYRR